MLKTMIFLKLVLQSLLIILSLPNPRFLSQADTILPSQIIKDSETISSSGRVFTLGFFSPVNSISRYLGIWHSVSKESIVWVANRDKPINGSSGRFMITESGNLVVTNGRKQILWSSNVTLSQKMNTSAQLLDTGNLVLKYNSTGQVIWESLAHPSDVFLPATKITHNVETGEKIVISSWRKFSNPNVGDFTAGLNAINLPQIFIWRGNVPHYRSGPWNGQILTGVQDMYSAYLDNFKVGNEPNGNVYFTGPPGNLLMKVTLVPNGTLLETMWDDQKKKWDVTWIAPEGVCDVYGVCGPFGSCDSKGSPVCSCLPGFRPKDEEEWGRGNWTGGCVRRTSLECDGNRSGFLRLEFMKLPDFALSSQNREDECRSLCLRNCSCTAYAYDSGIGCMFWNGSLIDIQKFPRNVGLDLYVRLANSELDEKRDIKLLIIIPVVSGLIAICICIIFWRWWKAKRKDLGAQRRRTSGLPKEIILKDDIDKVDLEEFPLFRFNELADATGQFHDKNKLGKGGFGIVYKGKLSNGKEIAIKRLSQASGQGVEEFMNEVVVISKLQHRNLVRLLGCCVEKEEKMLVYEYMPNKSLDFFLFDKPEAVLDWRKRFNIIEGIGRGLMYLHRDSRLKIIHRDLKPSNILLDEDWNPKISDFGIARTFGGNQDQANTARVIGTQGYMAPEYAMEGVFSEKSDVYSFGVLILEIISGKSNTSYYNNQWSLSLLGYAWKLWNEGNALDFIDPNISDSRFSPEILRCMHIGLLCVEDFPNERPNISALVSMLSSEIVDLAVPGKPAFAETWIHSQHNHTEYSVNNLTLTALDGR